MKKGIIISILLITGISLTCIGSDVTVKVGAFIRPGALTLQTLENLSFGSITILNNGSVEEYVVDVSGSTFSTSDRFFASNAHRGLVKITGAAGTTVAISSTPPTALRHRNDNSKTLGLSNMSIGVGGQDPNNVGIPNEEFIFALGGTLTIPTTRPSPGEYTADWPISVIYSGVYTDDYSYEPQNN